MKRGKGSAGSGSRRWTAGIARGVLEARERSGLSVNRFAARQGLRAERLYRWQHRLGKKTTASSAPPRFTEVHLTVPPPAAIEIVLADGVTLRFSGASRLDDAVAVLGRLSTR